jgi:signal transduction histidine kinase
MVAGVLAGLRVSTALGETAVYQRVAQLATLGDRVSVLTHHLEAERDLTAITVASPSKTSQQTRTLQQHQADVDTAADDVRTAAESVDGSHSPLVRDKLRDILNRLDKLKELRQSATQTKMPSGAIIDKYGQFISDLIDLDDLIAQGGSDAELAETTRTLAALARSKADSSRERALLGAALAAGRFQEAEFADFQGARAQRDSDIAAFRSSATTAQLQQFEDTVTGPEVDRAEFTRQRALVIVGKSSALSLEGMGSGDAPQWFSDMSVRVDRMRTVEDALVSSVADQSRALRDDAQRSAIVDGVLLFLVLAFVLAMTVIVAQSLVQPLRRLRSGALDVAGNRLPRLVDRLRDPDAPATGISVDPIDVDSTDEIGEVARSFDEVHREAVRLASNEAMLRGSMNALFVNLSRRSQSLIERQLRLIDDLEQGEQDEERLANLFKLDHLATRMRRNSENLLVLGGQEQVRRWNQPVPLIDVVRASLSEVEQYERVGLRIQGDVSVIGPVVNDLVHLVAELVENATLFSPDHTRVTISGHMLSGGGGMLQITDNGVGMAPEELEAVNWRLANPPVIDVSAARRMGLFVVGRLAVRNGIRVELRSALSGGLTAFVLMPARVIVHGATARDSSLGEGADLGLAASRRFDVAEPREQPVPATAGALESGGWARPAAITDPMPVVGGGTGPQPAIGGTGPRHALGGTSGPGPQSPLGGTSGTGPQPALGGTSGTGPQPAMGGTGPHPIVGGGTGPQPAVPDPRMPSSEPQPPSGESAIPSTAASYYPPSLQPPEPKMSSTAAGSDWSGESGGSIRREERLPIFDAIESEWFQRSSSGSAGGQRPAWRSPGDEGWETAESTVRAPRAAGRTSSGLPKRVPGKNRVPGSISASGPAASPKSPDVMRNRFASFQQGVTRGRAAARTEDTGEIQ